MKRCARIAFWSVFGLVSVGVAAARAQPTSPAEQRLSVEVTGGPTLGHKSSGFIAGEIDWALTNKIDVFVEVGHMANVGTSNLDANANKLATDYFVNTLGLPAQVGSTGIKVTHFDAGIRFHITPPSPKVHPYVIVGIGAASATTETTFTVNGQPIDPAAYGAALGGDLSGSNTKTILIFGGGITYPFSNRYFVDGGYRFGGILSKVSDIENDVTIKTQRIVFGVGMKF